MFGFRDIKVLKANLMFVKLLLWVYNKGLSVTALVKLNIYKFKGLFWVLFVIRDMFCNTFDVKSIFAEAAFKREVIAGVDSVALPVILVMFTLCNLRESRLRLPSKLSRSKAFSTLVEISKPIFPI